jgi:hypothetical protein
MMPSPRLGLLMLLHATDAGSTSLMTTSPECQAVMDMWCGTLTQCVSEIAQAGAKLPLVRAPRLGLGPAPPWLTPRVCCAQVARFGLQAKGQWRCYSPSALGDNGTKYLGGPQFCSQDSQLRTVLGICNGTLPQQPYPVPEEGSLPPSQQHGAGGDPAGPLLSTVIMRAGLDQTKCFRIPSVVGPFGSDSPSVLVFAEARENSCADAGSYSLASIRSPDGVNWPSNVRYLFNDTAARQMGSDGINLGASVYDARKKVVHVLFNQCADKFGAAPCGPTASILLLSSSDFGLSWAPLVNLTRPMVAGGFSMLNPGPGTGIQTSTGRLLVPAWGARIGVPKGRKCVGGCDRFWASAIYTDDGIDWKFTAPVPNPLGRKPNELQAALLPNSSIVLNARDEDGLPRLLATSTTDGNTWSPLTPNRYLVGSICQGSMVSAGGVLFFSHPFSRVSRSNGWIKYSVDG